jgi:hypothetical protein
MLRNPDFNIRIKSISTLSNLAKRGCFLQSSIPLLNALLTDPNFYVGLYAASALEILAERGIYDRTSIPLLNHCLKEPSPIFRINAIGTLERLAEKGILDKSTILPLHELLTDTEQTVCEKAENAWKYFDHLWQEKLRLDAEKFEKEKLEKERLLRKEQEQREKNEIEKERLQREEHISRIKKIEYAMNYSKAAELYEDIEMWEDARRCRALAQGSAEGFEQRQNGPYTQISVIVPDDLITDDIAIEHLRKVVFLHVPQFMDSHTTSEILVELNNTSTTMLTDISLDTSQLEEDFEVTGTVTVKTLSPGKALEQRINIKPRYEKGTFPVKIIIMAKGARVEKEYSIKVGGTEIY